ncbi:unnamed protein product, partial [Adineta ricciae]
AFQQTFNAGKPIAPGFGTRAISSAAPVSSAAIQAYLDLVKQIHQQVASGQISAADANKQLAAAFQQTFNGGKPIAPGFGTRAAPSAALVSSAG